MKRFKFGNVEITMQLADLKKIRHLFDTENDSEAMSKLAMSFASESVPFTQVSVDKLMKRIEFKR